MHLVAPADLPQAGDAGFDCELLPLEIGELDKLGFKRRPRTNQAHITHEHAVELGQLVEAVAPHPHAQTRDAGIAREFKDRAGHFVLPEQLPLQCVRVGYHGTKFVAYEPAPALAHHVPAIEDRTVRTKFHQNRESQE